MSKSKGNGRQGMNIARERIAMLEKINKNSLAICLQVTKTLNVKNVCE